MGRSVIREIICITVVCLILGLIPANTISAQASQPSGVQLNPAGTSYISWMFETSDWVNTCSAGEGDPTQPYGHFGDDYYADDWARSGTGGETGEERTLGQTVYAGISGVAIVKRNTTNYGNEVIIYDSESGFALRNAHLSDILVDDGQQVSAGSPIGRVGHSGRAKGSHLHIVLYKNVQAIEESPIKSAKANSGEPRTSFAAPFKYNPRVGPSIPTSTPTPTPSSEEQLSSIRVGENVRTTVNLNVRDAPGLSSTKILEIKPKGAIGTVVSGPVDAEGHTWWQIRWGDGIIGWSAQDGLTWVPSSSATTPPTETPSVNQPPIARITGNVGDQEIAGRENIDLFVEPSEKTQIYLSASSSDDPDGEINKYEWYLGGQYIDDHQGITGKCGQGTYEFVLVVTDDQGLEDQARVTVNIIEAPAEVTPSPVDLLPSPPSNLNATAVSSNQIDLLWQDNSDNELGFKIERRIGATGGFTEIANVDSNVITYSDTGLTENTAYSYRVTAYNAAGSSAYSSEISAATLSATPPESPTPAISMLEAARYTLAAGFTDEAAAIVVAIAWAESGGKPDARNYNPPTTRIPSGSVDRGILQINDYYHAEVSDACAFDPACAFREAFRISKSGTTFYEWVTYQNGTYENFLPDARQAVAEVTEAVITTIGITGVDPSQPTVSPSRQWLTITGTGFDSQSRVILCIGGNEYPIPSTRTQYVSSTQIRVLAGLTDPGTWTVRVVNSGGYQSNTFSFQILSSEVETVTLSFTSLMPSMITTSTAPHDATLSAGGTNFNNVNRVTFAWSGAVSGSATWDRGSSDWNNKVTVNSDTSITLRPRVVETNPTWSGTVTWTVTLRDTTGATASQTFTVTYEQVTYVTLTLYVHENSPSGPVIVGAQVSGQDGAGTPFSQVTNSSGYVTITGVPGTWSFTASKSGYDTAVWSLDITATDRKDAWLVAVAPTVDKFPNVTSFSVSPSSVTLGSSFTISYSVSDDVGLVRVELWQADDSNGQPVNFREIKMVSVSGKSYSGSFTDAPSSAGTYWYGLHVVDTAGEWNCERNSRTDFSPGVYGPIQMVVEAAPPPPQEEFPGQNASTLSDYYSAWGKSLPPLNERAEMYEVLGLGSVDSYAGTADQNTNLLNTLKQWRICPSTGEEVGYVP